MSIGSISGGGNAGGGGGSWGGQAKNNPFVVKQSDIDKWLYERNALKESNPFFYWLTGGDNATQYTLDNLGLNKKVVGAADQAFDIVYWIRENWQLAALGVVALLVLLRG